LGSVMLSWLCFQINMDNYLHFSLTKDGRLVSMGQHRLGFPRVLYDVLIHLGYNGDVPLYCCSLSKAHGLDVCEVSLTVPFNPTEPWMGTIIDSELDSTSEQTALIALTSLCESRLATITKMNIALIPIHNQEDPVWQQCLKAVSDLECPHFSVGMAEMAKYMQYLFNMQHNTARTAIQQRLRLTAYGEHIKGLRHENSILRSGTHSPLDRGHELQIMYHRHSEAKHGWNYNHQQLDLTRDEVDICTHTIIHLEHAIV
jgi:hypothetical protein